MFDQPASPKPPRWIELVEELDRRINSDGDLANWLFHGSPESQLYEDRYHNGNGVLTDGLLPRPAPSTFDQGVHLGTPRVAAHFAEHRTMSGEPPCLLAVPLEAVDFDLLEPDTHMVEAPVLVDREVPEHVCAQAERDVRTCWQNFGALIYPVAIAPDQLVVLRDLSDLQNKLPDPEMFIKPSP